ncbi:amidinotransferase (plasmid) [Embleya sp. NBC_00888]|uniref:amidinotransferase n=1 Tax=Embleya sp. NBC_00888 TaxID=2975960 RepID=UPI0038684026|nr:amidinotransferase [Embleya sp. NBC_00888]
MRHHPPTGERTTRRSPGPAIPVCSDNEWDPLEECVVGTARRSMFPAEDERMIRATMPREHWHRFVAGNPFPADIVDNAERELDGLSALLESRGVRVRRPRPVDWTELGGYTAAMPRDGFLVVGDRIVEAPMAWRSRRDELSAYLPLIREYRQDGATWLPSGVSHDSACLLEGTASPDGDWAINDSRPAWDAADFLRLGEGIVVGQLSHVTNRSGVEHLRERLGPGYRVHLLEPDDPHAMHIDASLCPLTEGLALYNPDRLTPRRLRHTPLHDWRLVPAPVPKHRTWPPLYMTSPWISMNLLVLGPEHVLVEAEDDDMCALLEELGYRPLRCPFRHVQSLGGSFHCATLDIRRRGDRPG